MSKLKMIKVREEDHAELKRRSAETYIPIISLIHLLLIEGQESPKKPAITKRITTKKFKPTETQSTDLACNVVEAEVMTPFMEWYAYYPVKGGRKKAQASWDKQKLDSEAPKMMLNLREQLMRDQGYVDTQYIPHPTTYLNQRMWEDDITERSLRADAKYIPPRTRREQREDAEAAKELAEANALGLTVEELRRKIDDEVPF